jgi:hypothetical protein
MATNIYALCEPGTLTVRYVGLTKYPVEHRVKHHLNNATRRFSPNYPVNQWIRSLGCQPDYVELETCHPDMARQVEKAWILLFIENGYDMLNVLNCDKRGKRTFHQPCPSPKRGQKRTRPTGDDDAND